MVWEWEGRPRKAAGSVRMIKFATLSTTDEGEEVLCAPTLLGPWGEGPVVNDESGL